MENVNIAKHKVGDIAFWGYDSYPYYLWGRISMVDGNSVSVDNYPGWKFQVRFSLPEKEGLELGNKLKVLRFERNSKIEDITQEFNQKLDRLIIKTLRKT